MAELFRSSPPLYLGSHAAPELIESIISTKVPIAELVLVCSRTITGSDYFSSSIAPLMEELATKVHRVHILGEPTAELIDTWVADYPDTTAVVGIGGGSVLDGAKALSAALSMEGSIEEYLEGVGTKVPTGVRTPLWLIPTTAGTGSETTHNAVLSKVGEGGYKKSLRHPAYLPDGIALDPELLKSAPSTVIAASGMDAITQLIEAYVSTKGTAATLGIARAGIAAVKDSLQPCFDGTGESEDYMNLLYGAYCSGVALTHAGLGVVHGAASTLGGVRPIPHGVLCGTMIPHAVELICKRGKELLREYEEGNGASEPLAINLKSMLKRYAEIGVILGAPSLDRGIPFLIQWLYLRKSHFALPGLREFGFTLEELMELVPLTSHKNSPLPLEEEDIALLYEQCW